MTSPIGGSMQSGYFDLPFLYSVSGILIVGLYIPQLLNIIKSKSPLQDISIVTWGAWALCLVISTIYALQIVHDIKFALISGLSSMFCALIATLTAIKRIKYRKVKTDITVIPNAMESKNSKFRTRKLA